MTTLLGSITELTEQQKVEIVTRFRGQLCFTTPIHAAACTAYDMLPRKSRDGTITRAQATIIAYLVWAGEIGITAGTKSECMTRHYTDTKPPVYIKY